MTFVSFVKRLWNPYAFLQSLVLSLIAVSLTLSLKSLSSFEQSDIILPVAVFMYVYWRNGVLNQTLHDVDSNAQENFDRTVPRLGVRSVDYIRGTPPRASDKITVIMTFATWCQHSRASFRPFLSLASKFTSPSTACNIKFLALTKCSSENTTQYIQDLVKHSSTTKPLHLGTVAFGVDKSNIITTLQDHFKCLEIPRCYVIKDNEVHWDGHPANLETVVAGLTKLYDTDSDDDREE